MSVERWNMLHPGKTPKIPYVVSALKEEEGAPIVAVTDFMKSLPDQVARWFPGRFLSLGTDGFGRSDTRESLRRFFEVDAESIVIAALYQLVKYNMFEPSWVESVIEELGFDPDKPYPPSLGIFE